MKWEYKAIKLATTGFAGGKLDAAQLEKFMNELGSQGWELVSAFDTNQAYGETRDVVVSSQKVGTFVGRIGNPAGRNTIPTYIPPDY